MGLECECVGAQIYPVGEVHGGGPSLSTLHLHLHLAPVLGCRVNWANYAHNAGKKTEKKT